MSLEPSSELSVVVGIATYNERDNLRPLVEEIRRTAPEADILITDDNSPDGTGALADELAAADPRIHVQHRKGKLGLGTAILAGMRWAMDHGFGVFLCMDADFSHHPRYLPAMIALARDHDVVIGSRYMPGGGTVNWPWSRRKMSEGINWLVRVTMRLPASDTSGGFRAYRTDLLRRTNLDDFYSKGYSFQQEMLLRCTLAGARIGETPIIFEDRRYGTTKANYREIVRSLSTVAYLGFLTCIGRGPKPKT
jgi:dolichol-phosphate mannosyltransferase